MKIYFTPFNVSQKFLQLSTFTVDNRKLDHNFRRIVKIQEEDYSFDMSQVKEKKNKIVKTIFYSYEKQ